MTSPLDYHCVACGKVVPAGSRFKLMCPKCIAKAEENAGLADVYPDRESTEERGN